MVHPQARRRGRGGALSARGTWSIPHFLWRREEEINKHGRRYRGNALPARTKRGSTSHRRRESIGSLASIPAKESLVRIKLHCSRQKHALFAPSCAPRGFVYHPVAGMAGRPGVLFALLYFERRMCMRLPHARLPVNQGCRRPACSRQHRSWVVVTVYCPMLATYKSQQTVVCAIAFLPIFLIRISLSSHISLYVPECWRLGERRLSLLDMIQTKRQHDEIGSHSKNRS